MFTKRYAVSALAAVLVTGQPLLAQEAALQPVQGAVEAGAGQSDPGTVEAVIAVEAVEPAPAQETAAVPGGMDTSGPGESTDEQAEADAGQGMAANPDMPAPGKKGCRMNKAGMMGMMHGAMGMSSGMADDKVRSCKTKACDGHSGISKRQYRELMGRLDVIDARLAKIDAMLERLLER